MIADDAETLSHQLAKFLEGKSLPVALVAVLMLASAVLESEVISAVPEPEPEPVAMLKLLLRKVVFSICAAEEKLQVRAAQKKATEN